MASYPVNIPSFTVPTATSPRNNPSHASAHSGEMAEIVAIATALGTNPQGVSASVAARFTTDEVAITAATSQVAVALTTATAANALAAVATSNAATALSTATSALSTAQAAFTTATAGYAVAATASTQAGLAFTTATAALSTAISAYATATSALATATAAIAAPAGGTIGSLIIRTSNGTYVVLAQGTSGQALVSAGAGAVPVFGSAGQYYYLVSSTSFTGANQTCPTLNVTNGKTYEVVYTMTANGDATWTIDLKDATGGFLTRAAVGTTKMHVGGAFRLLPSINATHFSVYGSGVAINSTGTASAISVLGQRDSGTGNLASFNFSGGGAGSITGEMYVYEIKKS